MASKSQSSRCQMMIRELLSRSTLSESGHQSEHSIFLGHQSKNKWVLNACLETDHALNGLGKDEGSQAILQITHRHLSFVQSSTSAHDHDLPILPILNNGSKSTPAMQTVNLCQHNKSTRDSCSEDDPTDKCIQ